MSINRTAAMAAIGVAAFAVVYAVGGKRPSEGRVAAQPADQQRAAYLGDWLAVWNGQADTFGAGIPTSLQTLEGAFNPYSRAAQRPSFTMP